MDHTARVRELDRETYVDERAEQSLALVGRGACLGLAENLGQRRARQALHHDVWPLLGIAAELVDRWNRRMVEPALNLCLASESRRDFDRRPIIQQALDRDFASHQRV